MRRESDRRGGREEGGETIQGFRIALLVVLAALGSAVTARAGSVTGVTAPPTVVVNHPVTITVQGVGPCDSVMVNFNTAFATTSPYVVSRFPLSAPHTYTATGPKTIQVTATGNCTGRATTTINVLPATTPPPPPPPAASGSFVVPQSLQALCAAVHCDATATALSRPTLSSLGQGEDSIQPGRALILSGFSLGTSQGSVRVRLPNGSSATVSIDSWTPSLVTGTLDGSISGVRDGDAQVVVQRSDNVLSNALTVHFVAAREIVQVPNSLVTISSCGDAAVETFCLASTSRAGSRFDFGQLLGGFLEHAAMDHTASFSGFHQNFWDDFGAAGDDQYDVTVPAGWVIDHFDPGVRTATAGVVQRFTKTDASPMRSIVRVDWSLPGGAQTLFYGGWFFAAGPRGVPLVP